MCYACEPGPPLAAMKYMPLRRQADVFAAASNAKAEASALHVFKIPEGIDG